MHPALVVTAALILLAPSSAQQIADPDSGMLVYGDRIELKLTDASAAWLGVDGHLRSSSDPRVAAVDELLREALDLRPLVPLPASLLDRWHREADRRLPPGMQRPGHLGRWLRLRCADADVASSLLERLRELPVVDCAYREAVPQSASIRVDPAWRPGGDDLPPTTPDFSAHQTYRGLPPDGFGFDASRPILGVRGQGVTLFHVEADWVFDHEDLPLSAHSFVGTPTSARSAGANHGTGVIGVVAALRNDYGMTGVADAVLPRLVPAIEHGIAGGVALATAQGRPGDVITLIGSYNLLMAKPEDHVPFEYLRANFDAILTAGTQGMLVVSSAGNGDNDLDDPRFARRFDLSMRDSLAILVGATEGVQPRRASFSNYGSRIDANGWGNEVATTGYGTLFSPNGDKRQQYTERYAGTSSATSILSGVAASLSGAVRQQLGRALTPLELRGLLRAHGTPISGNIGTRPDLPAMLAALGLPDGLMTGAAEVQRGALLQVEMSGPSGGSFGLALAFEPGSVSLGSGRPLHLDPSRAIVVGGFALVGGQASWSAIVPNDPAIEGRELILQGVAVPPSATGFSVSSSLAVRVD